MRTLIVTRGPQGAGKSTFIRSMGLGGYLISADLLRQAYGSPVMSRAGHVGVSQDHDSRVWAQLKDLLDERMARGELIVMDATHPNSASFKPYLKLAHAHRYRLICVDFSTIPLELTLARNAARESWKVVPERSVRHTWRRCRDGAVPKGVERICWSEDGLHATSLRQALAFPIEDLSAYRSVIHVGDLQGCISPLLAGPLAQGVHDEDLWIFVGDYCDRGLENDAVIRWLLDHAVARDNVRLLWGNHEDNLHRWTRGQEVRDLEFTRHTLPQLQAAGLTPDDIDTLCDSLEAMMCYSWRGHQVMVTHGGLPTVPEHPERLSTRQLAFGTGYHHDPIDEVFSRTAPEPWVQIHGHRNPYLLPPQAAPRSWNLEGAVEHGGQLRVLTLDERGFTPLELPNPHFRSLATRLALEDPLASSPLNPPWVGPEMPPPMLSPELFRALREHPLVAERKADSHPHIAAFNFTRDAFFNSDWDSLNTRARGLFINTETREVVARSYDKFFNVGERPETTLEALAQNLSFPITLYLKENGFLGILGYDARSDELLFASKSTLAGEFALWFRDIAARHLDPGGLERLRLYLRDTHSTMVFEVIDPSRDPHIIRYDSPQVVLLDMLHRGAEFQCAPYEQLRKIGDHFGFPVKQRAMRFPDWASFSGWLSVASQPGWTFKGEPVEGFVIQDSAGFLTKLKLDFYNHWKRMRSLKDRLLKVRGSQRPIGRDVSEPRVRAFYEWLMTQPDALLRQDITVVRQAYLEGEFPELPPEPPRPPVESKQQKGFRLMLDSLARTDGALKAKTADQALALALADDRCMDLLRASPVRLRVVMAATLGGDRDDAAEALGLDTDGAETPGPARS